MIFEWAWGNDPIGGFKKRGICVEERLEVRINWDREKTTKKEGREDEGNVGGIGEPPNFSQVSEDKKIK